MPGKRLLCDHKDDREASRPPQRGTYHQLLCLKEVLSSCFASKMYQSSCCTLKRYYLVVLPQTGTIQLLCLKEVFLIVLPQKGTNLVVVP